MKNSFKNQGLTPELMDTDSDNDGVPNAIENETNRNPYAAGKLLTVPDGDGFSDQAEMIAGTNPDASSDRPNLSVFDPQPPAGRAFCRFAASPTTP